MAESIINSDSRVLSNFDISLKTQDGQCNRDSVLSVFINYVVKGSDDYTLNFNQMVGILGEVTHTPNAKLLVQFLILNFCFHADLFKTLSG